MAAILSNLIGRINRKSVCCIERGFRHLVDLEPRLAKAISLGQPVVALESTIITHGMPFPDNVETAQAVEEAVLSTGALPATIALLKGRIRVGLDWEGLRHLTECSQVLKCSRRDLAFALASKASAGTTVSATMLIAHALGIRIFATGGIGGVHRNGHQTMDISADLTELGRTPVAVISSGVKSILDLERTLEVLETHGVCVASYGEDVQRFPDFYTRESDHCPPSHLKGPEEAATLISMMEQLNLQSGILIGVPVPKEHALDKQTLKNIIEEATREAAQKNIKGNQLTPYLLSAINRETHGRSLLANKALIKNNALVAGQIACELSALKELGEGKLKEPIMKTSTANSSFVAAKDTCQEAPFIIGATMMDICLKQVSEEPPLAFNGATYQSIVCQSAGGVAHNVAKSIYKLYGAIKFVSVVGNDSIGKILLDILPEVMRNGLIVSDKYSTATCSIILDANGESRLSMANMDILNELDVQQLRKYEQEIANAPLIVMDANLSRNTMINLFQLAAKYRKVIFYEPTDPHKASQPFLDMPTALYRSIRVISPNLDELRVIAKVLSANAVKSESKTKSIPSMKEQKPLPQSMKGWTASSSAQEEDLLKLLSECEDLMHSIEFNFDCIIVTLGCHGVVVSVRGDMGFEMPLFNRETRRYRFESEQKNTPIAEHHRRFYPAPAIRNIVNVSGAGDNFSAGFITGLLRYLNIDDSVAWGFVAASKSLQTEEAVPQTFFNSEQEKNQTFQAAIHSLTYQEL